jgi:hypothetical protein
MPKIEMIGKRVKLLIPIGGQQAGDVGIIKSSCGCSIHGWKVEFANGRTVELKQHLLNSTYELVEEVKEAV